jgi:hypothetical protein
MTLKTSWPSRRALVLLTAGWLSACGAPGKEPTTPEPAPDTAAPVTRATPAGGDFNSPRGVELVCDDGAGSGCAATYYTLDGSVPTQASPRYTAPLVLSASATLRFFSVDVAGNVEGARLERYGVDTEAPRVSASPRGGTHGASVEVTLTCDDGSGSGCASIHYTTDGSSPSAASSAYSAPLRLERTTRLRFLAVDRVGNVSEEVAEVYTPDPDGPVSTATPRGGVFGSGLTVTLACDDGAGGGCAATYFTTNGALPTRGSERYTGPISLGGSTMLRFFSVDQAGNDGPGVSEAYVIDTAPPLTTATPGSGTYSTARDVVLTCDDAGGVGCGAIFYSTSPTAPPSSFLRYSGPVRVSVNTTLRFFSTDGLSNTGDVKTETYVIDTVAPTVSASPRGGTFFKPRAVTLTCADGGSGCAAIHYTLNGGTPDTASPRYTGALTLSTSATLRFVSVDAAGNTSAVGVETYTFSSDTTMPLTLASPTGGIHGGPVRVTLDCTDPEGSGCAGTFYTLNGSEPTPSSLRYTGPFTLSTSTDVRFRSVDAAGNLEDSWFEPYTIDPTPPVTRATPGSGTFTEPVTVRLACTDAITSCRETRYTTDGSEPDMGSPLYQGPLTLGADTTVRFFSVDQAGHAEPVKTEVYDVALSADTASEQLAAVRALADGLVVGMRIDGALITYVKPGIAGSTEDPAGFFLQADPQGPALFVEADPSTLVPVPVGGERVNVVISERLTVNIQARVRLSSYTALSGGHPLRELVQDVSDVDVHLLVDSYESEYIQLVGVIGASGFVASGAGHVQAPLLTSGVPEDSPSAASLRLRVVEPVRDALDLGPGCVVFLVSPLWRVNLTTLPSVWSASQLLSVTCPAPRVTSAQSKNWGRAVVRFDRRIDPASVLADGSQFSIPDLTVTGATVSEREVWLETTPQTSRQVYTVTVASTVRDTQGSEVDPAAATATFKGFVQPAVLYISEVAPHVAPNVPQGRDLVELRAAQAGSVLGATLVDDNDPDHPLATLPDVEVRIGELMVIHLNPDRASGADAPESETVSVNQYPQARHSSNYDYVWDFQGGTTGISSGNRVLRIRDTFGVTQDAIPVISRSNSLPAFPAQLQALQAEGLWMPPTCGGAPCTYTSSPTALDVSVDWSGAFRNPGKAFTLTRVFWGDSDRNGDWAVTSSTLGRSND